MLQDTDTEGVPYIWPRETGINNFDQLRTIFAGQSNLMDKYHDIESRHGGQPVEDDDRGDLDSRTVALRLQYMFACLVRELSEAMQELPASKVWKQSPKPADKDKFREEMADSLHFFVEMCITGGITADDLFDEYFKAWDKNRARQAGQY